MTASYRDDPRWQEARDRYITDPTPSESADDTYDRRVRAALDMFEIERATEDSP